MQRVWSNPRLVRICCLNTSNGEILWTRSIGADDVLLAVGQGVLEGSTELRQLLFIGIAKGYQQKPLLFNKTLKNYQSRRRKVVLNVCEIIYR